VTEAAAICAYLADAFPQAKLAPPPGDRLRAPYYRWLFFAAGPIEAAVNNKAIGVVVPREREGMMGYGTVERVMTTLEDTLSRNEYLVGESFTAADLYLGAQVGFGLMFGTIEKRPAFQKYWQRVSARPAALRAKEKDDALMPKQKAAS
jgi:glutathione S-transferase